MGGGCVCYRMHVQAQTHTCTLTLTCTTHPTHLRVGVELCKLQYDVAGSDGQGKVKLDLILARGECSTLRLEPNAPLVLQLNGILHRPVAVVEVDHSDLPRGVGGRRWLGVGLPHHNAKVPLTSLSISLRGLPQVHWYGTLDWDRGRRFVLHFCKRRRTF